MSIGMDYPHPVNVNGFSCKNCTDVDYAKKHIDPAHPKSGPYNVNAATDPTNKAAGARQSDAFIRFGGQLRQTSGVDNKQSGQQAAVSAGYTAAGVPLIGASFQSVNITA